MANGTQPEGRSWLVEHFMDLGPAVVINRADELSVTAVRMQNQARWRWHGALDFKCVDISHAA